MGLVKSALRCGDVNSAQRTHMRSGQYLGGRKRGVHPRSPAVGLAHDYARHGGRHHVEAEADDSHQCPPLPEGTEIDIDENAYGAAILAIVEHLPNLCDMEECTLSLTVCCFAFGLLALNFTLQMLILAYISLYVVQPSVRKVQVQYQRFHMNTFSERGDFMEEAWDAYAEKEDLCHIAMTDPLFYFIILTCWTMTMMVEIRASEKLFRDFRQVPTCRTTEEMILVFDQGSEARTYIVALTGCTRALLYIGVGLPKIVLSIVLLWLGAAFLSATSNFPDLVMNAVAMEFVMNLDELLYSAVLPAIHRSQVAETKFFLKGKEKSEKQQQEAKLSAFRRSGVYLLGAFVFIMVYSQLLQNVLPPSLEHVKHYCVPFVESEIQPVCTIPGWKWFLEKEGSYAYCYPFGPQS